MTRLLAPRPIENVTMIYIVLAFSAAFEGYSWWVSKQSFRKIKGREGYWQAVRHSKNPPAFMVLFEDSAALLGIAIVAIATAASSAFSWLPADGLASLLIGLILAGTATVVARECKDLLIGEQANPAVTKSIRQIADDQPDVDNANGIVTFQLGPQQIVVALSLEFSDRLCTPDIERRISDIEDKVRARHPEVIAIFIKPQSQRKFDEHQAQHSGLYVPQRESESGADG